MNFRQLTRIIKLKDDSANLSKALKFNRKLTKTTQLRKNQTMLREKTDLTKNDRQTSLSKSPVRFATLQ